MASGSVVVITVAGVNITAAVLWASATFESQLNAVPGTFEFTVKDVDHSFSFVTGSEVVLTIDGVRYYGGFLLQVQRTYPFPAMDTVTVAPVDTARYFVLRGVDYNILFDKRVLRNPANYLVQIPNFANTMTAGELIRQMCTDYLDIPSGFDTSTYVDDLDPPFDPDDPSVSQGAWNQQGDTFRQQMESFTLISGAVWYFDADKNLHHHSIESAVQRWGFSDQPNRTATVSSSPVSYQGVTVGPRAIEATQDGSYKVSDALIWGGSQFAGAAGGTVFARETASPGTGIVSYQIGQTHFGEPTGSNQAGVDAIANVIVNGSPGAVGADQNRGLKYDQWSIKLDWYAHAVPTLSGSRDHIRPGFISTITLKVFETSGTDLVQYLPLRQVTLSFPQLDPTGKGYVQFSGLFALQPDDPYSLWRFLLKLRAKKPVPTVTTTTDASTSSTYGSYGSFVPTPVPNGAATVFTIGFGYIAGTTSVYRFPSGQIGGYLLRRGIDYTETDPVAGKITIPVPIPAGDELLVNCRTL